MEQYQFLNIESKKDLQASLICEKLQEHDLFMNLTSGLPQEIVAIARLVPKFENLDKLCEHLRDP